ncbi:glycosylphosphatidylinositol anchor biosynthesis [Elasticomyces elasticus]|nr:glycosylphosphatidylinositol anchor biosynthesis [Elasticomyces elasticus]KAK3656411.1 glycosylphosphatidylinositol anchor biosynthesis [Elasticomyces elasticus]
MSKIIAVFGASGNQGGSVIRALLDDAALSKEFKIRAVTRDINKDSIVALKKEGVEAVVGDMQSSDSVAQAVKGAHTVFLVTNFWETFSADTEISQGKAVADACKNAGVKHLIFSSLINVTETSKGRLPNIAHFDGKARVETYIREIGVPATFVMPGVFMSGYFDLIREGEGGSYSLALPVDGKKAQIPLLDAAGDTGKFVRAIIQDYPASVGKQVRAAVDYYTPERLVAEFSEVLGRPASFMQIPADMFKSFLPPPVAQEILENMFLFEDPGYYAGATLSEGPRPDVKELTSWKDFVSANKDHTRLRPEDAIYGPAPPRNSRPRQSSPLGRSDTVTPATTGQQTTQKRHKSRRNRSADRRRKGTWKKLLWVKQNFPDNYTDEETFLDHLQRNPRLRPYEFWPLVADSTIIVQHVCSVVIFVCCFTGIFQERISPQTIVGWATSGTVAGWVLRDWWQGKEEVERAAMMQESLVGASDGASSTSDSGSGSTTAMTAPGTPSTETPGTIRRPSGAGVSQPHSRNISVASADSTQPVIPIIANSDMNAIPGAASIVAPPSSPPFHITPYQGTPSPFSSRTQERLTTAKSALLIYCSLLGLSPILKSLTKSTSSDSIWALSFWLMILNVFTFDYGAGPGVKFPASLSTNAALMASTVLASRLPTTTHVFSLTLFSIEVFGLFPVFRRHLRHHSWTGHLWLTTSLVVMAGTGLSMVISGGGWGWGILGAVGGCIGMGVGMGMTSWWLIGLQRYKNEIRGPWDPARPVIRRGWD